MYKDVKRSESGGAERNGRARTLSLSVAARTSRSPGKSLETRIRARDAHVPVMAARYLSIESAGKRLHRTTTVDLTQKRPGAAYNKHLLPRPTTTHNTRCFRSGTARAASTCMVPSSSSQGHTRPHRSACTARGYSPHCLDRSGLGRLPSDQIRGAPRHSPLS